MTTNPAKRFPGDADIRCQMSEWNFLQEFRLLIQYVLITVSRCIHHHHIVVFFSNH